MSGKHMSGNRCELMELGFSIDTWGEVVMVFYSKGEVIGLMPVGLKLSEGCTLAGRLYRGSKLYSYIASAKVAELPCIACISENPQLFYMAVFEKSQTIEIFTEHRCPEEFCDACLIGLCKFFDGDEAINFKISVKEIALHRKTPRVFTRASAAIIEALVWFTKLPYVDCKDIERVLERIELLKDTVYRSSQKNIYAKLIENIYLAAFKLVKEDESSRCGSRDKNI
uniref:DUF447 family protein n=1 Tax=Ignisphaera aggregans TaxID=334771 RepID=A0A7J2U357_9CREN